MEKSLYLKKFKVGIGILLGGIVLFAFSLSQTIPQIQKIINIQNEYKTQSDSLTDAERRLEGLKKASEAKKIEEENIAKAFFKPIGGGNDTETVISDEFEEILQIIRSNKIKTRSIKYDYDPQDDNFVKNVGAKYHVCRVSAEMIANYSDFANFLRQLYKHEHFLEISKIEIVPYNKNKRILLISLQIKLYAQKDPATAAAEASAATNANPETPPNIGENAAPEAPEMPQ